MASKCLGADGIKVFSAQVAYRVLAYSVSPVKKQAVVDALLNCVGTLTADLMPPVVLISNSAPLVDTKVRPAEVCTAFSALGNAVTWATCVVAVPATAVVSAKAAPVAAVLHVEICRTCIRRLIDLVADPVRGWLYGTDGCDLLNAMYFCGACLFIGGDTNIT